MKAVAGGQMAGYLPRRRPPEKVTGLTIGRRVIKSLDSTVISFRKQIFIH
jgi:hypothetical protein